jgi:hypothetical protein
MMSDYVVIRQNPNDDWMVLFVDVTADTPEAAIEFTALNEQKGGEGRYIAIPNEWWTAQNVTIKRIAEVNLEKQGMV